MADEHLESPKTSTNGADRPDPANPYNIDYERERRLKRTFQLLIGVGFVVAAILIFVGYMMDSLMPREADDLVPVTPYSSPAVQTQK